MFAATDEEQSRLLPSGGNLFNSRVQWGITYLVQAGVLSRPKRGHVQITDRGREILVNKPGRIDLALLRQFDDFVDFQTRTRSAVTEDAAVPDDSAATPVEAIETAIRENDRALATELLQRVLEQPPVFLERMVVKLLTAMGYGGRAGASSEHLGRSGDGGIDGVVYQDVLGLDRVYVQAKRYSADNAVGRPDVQAFVGALHGQQADRGVFITTSRYTTDAESYVGKIPNRIVLIDGKRLAELMILHNVGVQDESTFVLKRLDEDFFETS